MVVEDVTPAFNFLVYYSNGFRKGYVLWLLNNLLQTYSVLPWC